MMTLCTLLLLSGFPGQDPAAEAGRLVAALQALKDTDEEGFDETSDRILKLGEKALDAIEAALPQAKGAAHFRLLRVRDMLWYPINIKGAYLREMGNQGKEEALGMTLGDIYLSFNGQAITDHYHYTHLLGEAEKAGLKQAVIEILQKGRRKQVALPGLRMGGYLSAYPHELAHYVHNGHRDPAWDEDAKQAFNLAGPDNVNNVRLLREPLLRAADAGCRDTRLVKWLVENLIKGGRFEEAVKYWLLTDKEAVKTRYGGAPWRELHVQAARAFLYTGRREEARQTIEQGSGLATLVGDRQLLGMFELLLAVHTADVNLSEAANKALSGWAMLASSPGLHYCWNHDIVSNILRRAGRFEDLARKALEFGHDRDQSPSPKFDQSDMGARFKGGLTALVPPERLFPSEEAVKTDRWGGLLGSYFAGTRFEGAAQTRIDPGLCFYWGLGSPLPGIPKDNFSIRWTGFVEPEFTDTYTFTVRVDDGIRLWVDNKLIIDRWHGQVPTYHSGTISLEARRRVPLKVEYFEINQGAGLQLYWECPSFVNRRGTHPWTLVYRNTFENPELASTVQNHAPARFNKAFQARNGKLQSAGPTFPKAGTSWGSYDSVKVESTIRILTPRNGWASTSGLRACAGEAFRSEIKSILCWPRVLMHSFYLDAYGRNTELWSEDLSVPHRFSIEIQRGRASTRIDGKEVDIQPIPTHWTGAVGLSGSGDFEIDDYEIWVPSARPTPAEDVRAHYDRAYAALKERRITEGLEALEQAALLQPRHEELAALYATALAGDRDLLEARLAVAASPRVARLLLEAETHLGLFDGDAQLEEAVRSVRSSLHDGRVPSDSALEVLNEAAKPGTLDLAARALHHAYDRGLEVGANRVDAAYAALLKGDPRAVAGWVRSVRFLQSCGRGEEAAPLLKEIARRIPRTEAMKKEGDN